jgi:putative flippase GtrA
MKPTPRENQGDRALRRSDFVAGLMKFGAVGVFGFIVDSAVLYAAIFSGFDHYSARILSFLAAVTATWLANRRLTFDQTSRPSFSEWSRYAMANMSGGALNLAIYSILTLNFALVYQFPIIGVGIGSISGLFLNFILTRSVVFKNDLP